METSSWLNGLRRRLHRARLAAGLSYAVAATVEDGTVDLTLKDRILRAENGTLTAVTVDLVVWAQDRYGVPLEALLVGWPGWDDGAPPPRGPGETVPRSPRREVDMDHRLRRNLAAARRAKGLSQVEAGARIGQPYRLAMYRLEAGLLDRLSLALVARLADVYDVSLMSLFRDPEDAADGTEEEPERRPTA